MKPYLEVARTDLYRARSLTRKDDPRHDRIETIIWLIDGLLASLQDDVLATSNLHASVWRRTRGWGRRL